MTLIGITLLILNLCNISYVHSTYVSFSILCGTACACENNIDEGLVKLDCSREYLSIVPSVADWPENITHLDVSNNNITTLDSELAHGRLTVLDLSHNNIRSVVQNAFGGLKKLKYLNIANNNIQSFADDGFYGLEQLKSLNLSSNGLQTLPNNLFYRFIGLQELSLADNPLVHLDPQHFNRMISLRWLDLSFIDAYTLDPKIFYTTGQLEFIDLSGNEFTDVPTYALRSAKKLKHLRLNENPISKLQRSSFTKLKSLEVLELNFIDKLRHVEDETFSELTNLSILEMKYCRELTYISSNAFAGLFNDSRPVLKELDLEGNQLRSIYKDMVPCARLRKFNIQQNPWICDCMFRWIKDCQIQKIYSADLKCASPSRLVDSLVVNLKDDQFKCEFEESEVYREELHHNRIVRSVSVGLGVALLVILSMSVIAIFKWKDLREYYRKHRKGPGAVYYVRAKVNPGTV